MGPVASATAPATAPATAADSSVTAASSSIGSVPAATAPATALDSSATAAAASFTEPLPVASVLFDVLLFLLAGETLAFVLGLLALGLVRLSLGLASSSSSSSSTSAVGFDPASGDVRSAFALRFLEGVSVGGSVAVSDSASVKPLRCHSLEMRAARTDSEPLPDLPSTSAECWLNMALSKKRARNPSAFSCCCAMTPAQASAKEATLASGSFSSIFATWALLSETRRVKPARLPSERDVKEEAPSFVDLPRSRPDRRDMLAPGS
mmetsp:Transcript_16268/g.26050  ORF Transcript_16268/g.26050 Transcript_16268/m.26050 type:complete len:265 (-) Transcript_16268:1-795(-)